MKNLLTKVLFALCGCILGTMVVVLVSAVASDFLDHSSANGQASTGNSQTANKRVSIDR